MKNSFKILEEEFVKIKKLGEVKSFRRGTTGVGYTFETLLCKKEDQLCRPDFLDIEIKCKLGYTKSPIHYLLVHPRGKVKML